MRALYGTNVLESSGKISHVSHVSPNLDTLVGSGSLRESAAHLPLVAASRAETIRVLDEHPGFPLTFFLDSALTRNIIQYMLNYFSQSAIASPVNLETLANQLKVLAEPNRLLIFNLLMEGVQCNCELGDALDMPPNLISHHLRALREAGLVDVERDALDARWMYYSVNREALDELNAAFGLFFDPERIQPRRLTCGPQGTFVAFSDIARTKAKD